MQPLPIGKTEIHNQVFTILPDDRRKHMAIFGKSGVGKTTLMKNMIVWDIHEGLGVTILDPHGGLIDDILDSIPRDRTNDVILFDPRDQTHAIGINILEHVGAEHQPLVVSSLVSIFKKIWHDSWGPRLEDILRNAAFALIEQPKSVSLVAIPKLLTDHDYRKEILAHVSNTIVLNYFKNEYDKWTPSFQQEATQPVLNKTRAFLANPLLRDIIGQTKSSFDFRWLLDNNKILLCNLSKGALGEDVSSLLGSLIVTKVSLAALSRQDAPEDDVHRPLHVLYADEVQNFIYGVDLATILAEARKYHLVLAMATQTLSQLPEPSIAAVFGNCATIMSFRVGGDDAQVLQREFAEVLLPASQLQDLPDYKLYIRTMMKGTPTGPHRVQAFPLIPNTGSETTKERVIRTSLERYARPRAEIEAKLHRFMSH